MATRIDQIEWCEVSSDIEGEPVPGNATLYAHADRTDLAIPYPAAGRAITPLCRNAERRTRDNQRRLECANVRAQ
jgi:hypothetical protein